MKKLHFKKIDAFTKGKSTGNPAGVIFLKPEKYLTNNEMQHIARECKGYVNEVAFVTPQSGKNTAFSLRYFSSEKEVALCGHATIAAIYDIIKEQQYTDMSSFLIKTPKGKLSITNRYQKSDAIFLSAPSPHFREELLLASNVADALGISSKALDKNHSIAIVNSGLETLIVGINSLQECLHIKPDFETIKNYCEINGIDIVTVFCTETTGNGKYRTRVFAPTFGYLEDPATGSGNAALGYYLLKHNDWDGTPILIEQGPSMDDPNIVQLATKIENNETRVLFGGSGQTKFSGEYHLHYSID